MDDTTWKIGDAELVRRRDVWYLHITQTKPDPAPNAPGGVIGVDRGIVNLATDSDGETYSGQQVQQVRERCFRHRRRLQTKNTRRARWRLRQLAGEEKRFQRDMNHRISKRLVQKAQQQRKALALEDLTGIRARATVRRSQRRQHASWAFFQLRQFVSYKAQCDGVWVYLCNAHNTSRTCHVCGYCDQRNRKTRDRFVCLRCGHTQHADEHAASTISRVDVNPPMVLRHPGGGASTSCLL